jgi:hypothetical protein
MLPGMQQRRQQRQDIQDQRRMMIFICSWG